MIVLALASAACLVYAQDSTKGAPAMQDMKGMKGMKETKGGAKMEMKDKETTVEGEVVDVSCYLHHGDKGIGEGHKGCAEACAKAGGPLGILTADGKLYVSVMPDDHSAGPNAMLMEHLAAKVSATGFIRTKAGVHGIMISKVEAAKVKEGY
jgi:hypothetical protein